MGAGRGAGPLGAFSPEASVRKPLPPLEPAAEAVLICNGPSAEGYEAPAGVYALCLNGGFMRHRADGALTVDCPGHIRSAWHSFQGEKVVSAHMPEFPTGERFECFDLVSRYGSATPAALVWLARRKACNKVTIVGLDSLWGAGNPDCKYNRHVRGFLAECAQYFAGGVWVERDGRSARVGTPEFEAACRQWGVIDISEPKLVMTKPAPAGQPDRSLAKSVPQAEKCLIRQTMVEFDVSPRCTRKCAFCSPGIPKGRRKQKAALSLDAHNLLVDELVALGFNRSDRIVCYCGHGEPTLAPGLPYMLRHARERLPAAQVVVYTNGDTLDARMCGVLEANDVTWVVVDLYDAEAGPRLAAMVAGSQLDPARVRILDHSKVAFKYNSRCSTVDKPRSGEGRPCVMPAHKLFITDLQGEPAALLCCEDYPRATISRLAPGALKELAERAAGISAELAKGRRSAASPACARCDVQGGSVTPIPEVYQALTSSPYWPPRVPAAPKAAGRRLVVLPTNAQWAGHARAVIESVNALSSMDGETLLLWNDDAAPKCPTELSALPGVKVIEYPRALGWTGINHGIGQGFARALAEGFDYAVKLDTDTAILRRGWDSAICSAAHPEEPAIIGFYLEENCRAWAGKPLRESEGIFRPEIVQIIRKGGLGWARRYFERHQHHGDHMQGGCYALTKAALVAMDRSCGLVPAEDEAPIGEDILFSLRAKIAGLEFRHNWAALIHYMPCSVSYHPEVVRFFRDHRGAAVIHPVKSLAELQALAREAAR